MRGHRHTIILVDDEGEARDALRDHLVAMEVDVLCARHGRAALQLTALGIRPCAFLVEVESPAVAGAELLRAASQCCPDLVRFRRPSTQGRLTGATRLLRGPRTRASSRV